MAKKPSMTDEEIASLIEGEISDSVGSDSGSLSERRRKALRYYNGEPFGNENVGRSQFVSLDVADTIEWIMPSLMKMFMSTDDPVRFDPVGPEDEAMAPVVSGYCNHVFVKQNPGFKVLYTFFKDALLQTNGFVKVYWEEREKISDSIYEDMSMEEVFMMLQEEEQKGNKLEVIAAEPKDNNLFDVNLRLTRDASKICVTPIPPEELFVNKNAPSDIQMCRFVAHKCEMRGSELTEMGIDISDVTPDDDSANTNERIDRFLPEQEEFVTDNALTEETKLYRVIEAYPMLDLDGDGIAERRCIIVVGNKVKVNYVVDRVPIVTTTPILMSHKLYGKSITDLVMDLQELKSQLIRQILDNMYLTNNSRMSVVDGMVNMSDLLTNRPGGIVRTKMPGAVTPLAVPFFGAPAFTMLEYIDTIRENRSGVTRYNQGMNADSLNKTASGIQNIMNASQQRSELIARVFAESVKDIFNMIYELAVKHERRKMMRLNNAWIQIQPRDWADKYDLSVNVGLGTGSKEQVLQGSQLLLGLQKEILAVLGPDRIVNEGNVYNLAKDVSDAVFPRMSSKYFTDPAQLGPRQPPPPDPKIELAKYKAELMDQTKRDAKSIDFMTRVMELKAGDAKHMNDSHLKQMQIGADVGTERLGLHMEKLSSDVANHKKGMDYDRREEQVGQKEQPMKEQHQMFSEAIASLSRNQEMLAQGLTSVMKAMSAPKRIKYDENGEPVGVEVVMDEEPPQAEQPQAMA